MTYDQRNTPVGLTKVDDAHVAIEWADGHTSRFQMDQLRAKCPCAQCVDEWTGEGTLDPASVPEDVHPLSIQSVGRYAIQISWSDGHSTGIYPYQRLRDLTEGPC